MKKSVRNLQSPPGSGLRIVYQPIIDAKNDSVFGHEALARIGGKAPAPAMFKQIMMASGKIQTLDRVCMALAIANRPQPGVKNRLFVNMLPRTIISLYETGELRSIINTSGCPLVIEVTETERQSSPEKLRQALTFVGKLGAEIAVDDLLNGYDRLQTASLIEPNFIKIPAFSPKYSSSAYRAMVKSILLFAREVGASVIAERVETERDVSILAEMGIHLFQGYYFARPGEEYRGLQYDQIIKGGMSRC